MHLPLEEQISCILSQDRFAVNLHGHRHTKESTTQFFRFGRARLSSIVSITRTEAFGETTVTRDMDRAITGRGSQVPSVAIFALRATARIARAIPIWRCVSIRYVEWHMDVIARHDVLPKNASSEL
jgi:hypothetical protein